MLSVVFLMSQGCSTTVPLHMTFPEAPPTLMTPAPNLKELTSNNVNLSDLLDNANENYGNYYELKERYLAWQEWYKTQRKIFEEVK